MSCLRERGQKQTVMNYKNFKNALLGGIKADLGLKDFDIIRRDISSYPIPDEAYIIKDYVLYPNYLYYIYENNDSPVILDTLISQAVRGIKDRQIEKAKGDPDLLAEMKKNIFPVLIDPAVNRTFLSEEYSKGRSGIATTPVRGMTAIYKIALEWEDGRCASISLTYDLKDAMNINSDNELFSIALENMQRMIPAEIMTFADIAPQYVGSNPLSLYVVSNRYNMYGAAGIFQNGVAVKFAKEHGNFYAMFSSVNEVLLLTEKDAAEQYVTPEAMRSTIIDGNIVLSPEKTVTNDLYYFDLKDCSWSIVK